MDFGEEGKEGRLWCPLSYRKTGRWDDGESLTLNGAVALRCVSFPERLDCSLISAAGAIEISLAKLVESAMILRFEQQLP
jgi:hypothetical protein